MTDHDDGPPAGETPIQKALRLKKAALAAQGSPSGRARDGGLRAAAAHSASKSKPWMKK
ncbi:MAG: hypothetical protein ACK56C_12495 [Alphaproteobacteria bacterium]